MSTTTRACVRHELRLLARTPVTGIVSLLLVIVVGYATLNGARWADEQRATLQRVDSEDRHNYDAIYAQLDDLAARGNPQGPLELAGMAWYIFQKDGAVAPAPHMDPRRAEAAASEWNGARHAVLPPPPLAALGIGQSDLHPFYTRVTIRTRPMLVQSDEIENPINLLSGRLDLAFALTFGWPLLVLPLVYNVLSDEREQGTWALLASQPVSVGRLLAMRLALRLGLPWVLTVATIALVLTAFTDVTGLERARAIAVCGAILGASAAFWGGLCATVGLFGWRSVTTATAVTACWLALVVIAPAVISELAQQIAPVPSRVELVTAVRQAGSLSSGDVAALVRAYYEAHPDTTKTGVSADEVAIRGLAQQDEVDRRIEPVLRAYRDTSARQQSVVDVLRLVSPPLLVHDAVTELAGTTGRRYRRFADQVDAFHRAWREYYYPLVHARALLTRAHYEAAPRFAFEEEPSWAGSRRALALAAVTAVAGLALLALGVRGARRARMPQTNWS